MTQKSRNSIQNKYWRK